VRPLSKYCHAVLRKGPIDIGRTLPTRLHTSPLREVPPPELAAELEQLGSGAVGARAPRPPAARRFKMKTSGRPRAEPQSTSPLCNQKIQKWFQTHYNSLIHNRHQFSKGGAREERFLGALGR
jgi:hypothetical protein